MTESSWKHRCLNGGAGHSSGRKAELRVIAYRSPVLLLDVALKSQLTEFLGRACRNFILFWSWVDFVPSVPSQTVTQLVDRYLTRPFSCLHVVRAETLQPSWLLVFFVEPGFAFFVVLSPSSGPNASAQLFLL